MPKWSVFASGTALTLLQIVLICLAQGKTPSISTWENMYHWDSEHYGDIAATGYFSEIPKPVGDTEYNRSKIDRLTNVAFFPGYPLAARTFLTWGLSKHLALLFTAAIANIFFWTYFLLLSKKLLLRMESQLLLVLFIVSQPAAFYLVAGYSESLFLAGLCGMLYWSTKSGWKNAAYAGLHGFVMSLTRVFGVPLMILPLATEFFERLREKKSLTENHQKWLPLGLISFLTAMGAGSFFLYCQYAFGWWNLYFARQQAGWDLRPAWLLINGNDFWALFWPKLTLLAEQTSAGLPTITNRVATWLMLWLLVASTAVIVREWKKRSQTIALQTTFLLAAWMLWYMPVATLINADWRSMLRYVFPATIFLALALAPTLQSLSQKPFWRNIVVTLVAGVSFGLLTLEWELIGRFADALWVA